MKSYSGNGENINGENIVIGGEQSIVPFGKERIEEVIGEDDNADQVEPTEEPEKPLAQVEEVPE